MSAYHIIRAWRDAEYRASLSAAERAALPEHPAGTLDLNADDLQAIAGGNLGVASGGGGGTCSAAPSPCTLWNCTNPGHCTQLNCPTTFRCIVWG